MEVDENVPDALAAPEVYTSLNCLPVLNWIIRALLVAEERKGDRVLVSCRLIPRRTTGEQSFELEIGVSGDAVVFASNNLERVAKASADSSWLSSAMSRGCLSVWRREDNHAGHAECLADSTFAHAVQNLIADGGRMWIEDDRDSETRAIVTLPFVEAVPSFDMEDNWALSCFDTGDILFATRSPSLSDDSTLRNILANLGLRLSHSWYEQELERIKNTELIKAVMTSSPGLIDFVYNLPHLKDKPIILLLNQNAVTRINVRWCMERHVCAVLTAPLTHMNTHEALQKARSWHPTLFSLPDPSPQCDILVAEDNFVNQRIITKLLERLYHKVEVVENGLLAVDAVADRWHRKRPYDLVLMDTFMPVMNGYDAVNEIQRFEDESGFPPTPIVMLYLERGGRDDHMALNDEQAEQLKEALQKKIDTLSVEVDREGVKGTKADYNKINAWRAEIAKYQKQIEALEGGERDPAKLKA
ncbi:hypothetical protein FRC01_009052 [Tulasnella sp. 417]|nr:hypothetical protein FRC01_009052 [Tulasnella sp. 417]